MEEEEDEDEENYHSAMIDEFKADMLDIMRKANIPDAEAKLNQFCAPEEIVDRDEALFSVRQRGVTLRFVAESLRADREVVLAAVTQNGLALELAAEELQNDKELLEIAEGVPGK